MMLKRLLLLIGKNLLYFTDLKIPAILLTKNFFEKNSSNFVYIQTIVQQVRQIDDFF